MLELYHHGSSVCAAKVRFALAEKQLPWTGHYVDILRGDQFKPDFLAINAKAVVPVLVHDGYIVRESTVICEYADEVFRPHPIYPDAPRERAEVRMWTKAVDEELHPACSALTYIVSHRHTIIRNGIGTFDAFLKGDVSEGTAARTLKWQWLQQGLAAPGAADKIRLYDGYLHKMDAALQGVDWLVADRMSMADIAMAPYVNRLAVLSMESLWQGGRLPRVERWFDQIRGRATFVPAFVEWMPAELTAAMQENGRTSWPEIKAMLAL